MRAEHAAGARCFNTAPRSPSHSAWSAEAPIPASTRHRAAVCRGGVPLDTPSETSRRPAGDRPTGACDHQGSCWTVSASVSSTDEFHPNGETGSSRPSTQTHSMPLFPERAPQRRAVTGAPPPAAPPQGREHPQVQGHNPGRNAETQSDTRPEGTRLNGVSTPDPGVQESRENPGVLHPH